MMFDPRSSIAPGAMAAALASGTARSEEEATQAHQRQRSATIADRASQPGSSAATSNVNADFDTATVEFKGQDRQAETLLVALKSLLAALDEQGRARLALRTESIVRDETGQSSADFDAALRRWARAAHQLDKASDAARDIVANAEA